MTPVLIGLPLKGGRTPHLSSKPKLSLIAEPHGYFQKLITEAMKNQKVVVQPETEIYLARVLSQFMSTDNLYARDGEGNRREEALVLMLKEALEESEREMQRLLFRQLGDVSLYVAGFFQDSFAKKLVDIDYYIDMGGTAYHHVAVRADRPPVQQMFHELAGRFGALVDVLAEVSERTTPQTEERLLRTYDIWLRTRSRKAAKSLKKAGILPNPSLKKKWQ